MTGIELKAILDTYKKPPTHENKAVVFSLYTRITGKNPDRNCIYCAIECFLEMRSLAKEFQEKEIPLIVTNKNTRMKIQTINKGLIQYRIKEPFRAFGNPKVQTNENTTDAEVEMLINSNRALRGHFERIDGQDIMLFQEVNKINIVKTSDNPKKVTKKKAVK
jgi:hypothetical protein